MFGFNSKNKKNVIDEKLKQIQIEVNNDLLSSSIEKNLSTLKEIFVDNDVLVTRPIESDNKGKLNYLIAYMDGLVNSVIINDSIIKPLMLIDLEKQKKISMDTLINSVVMINEVKKTQNWAEIIEAINYGDSILFMDGEAEALILNSKGLQTRAISEPESERNLKGPREGFSEAIITNLSLVRRKIRTNELKMKFYTFGERTKTKACVCYMDSLVNKNILKDLYKRLDKIDIDGVLGSQYLSELITDCRWSPFESIGNTERPDVVVGKLLEGRIAIFVDGTPVVITAPYLFVENFQSSEDYYLNFYYASFSRLLRMLALIITLIVPAFYIAIVAFHHEILPTPLLVSITMDSSSVPFPTGIEAFVMLIIFDVLKETGIRMSSNVGQALSIVGALVIGQSAVTAKFVSAPMIIVVAITGITSLLVPKMNSANIVCRYFLLFCASFLGLEGLACGLLLILIHVLNLKSFGVSQFVPMRSIKYQEIKDIVIRAPWWQMITRPSVISTDKVRLKSSGENTDD